MMRVTNWLALCLWTASVGAAEKVFAFSQCPTNQTPPAFRALLAGGGQPGDWRIVLDKTSPGAGDATNGPATKAVPVLAQLSTDPSDERFPILIYDEASFGDFTLTTRFKLVSGEKEQMAGIVFRLQDEKNFYVIRASALGSTLRFYAVVDGERTKLIGPDLPIAQGVWHQLLIECRGNNIRCLLDGKAALPPLTDLAFLKGRIGFWTKSDAVSYFADTKLEYVPQEPLAQMLVRDELKRYPRILAMRIYASTFTKPQVHIIASNQPDEIGKLGEEAEQSALNRDIIYCSTPKHTVTITLPLHDRNGEVMGAVQLKLKSFLGQTEQNAIARALPIAKGIEARVRTKTDLLQ